MTHLFDDLQVLLVGQLVLVTSLLLLCKLVPVVRLPCKSAQLC